MDWPSGVAQDNKFVDDWKTFYATAIYNEQHNKISYIMRY